MAQILRRFVVFSSEKCEVTWKGCVSGWLTAFGCVFWPVDHFIGLCCQPLKGQSEVSCRVGQSPDHRRRASEGKSKLEQQKKCTEESINI